MKVFLYLFALSITFPNAWGCDFSDPFHHWPLDLRINGKVYVGTEADAVPILANVLSDSEISGRVAVVVDPDLPEDLFIECARLFYPSTEFRVLRRSSEASFDEFAAVLPNCDTVLWLSTQTIGDRQLAALRSHTKGFKALIERGGTVAAFGPAAGSIARFCTFQKNGESRIGDGIGLIPDSLLQFAETSIAEPQILSSLSDRAATVGMLLAPGTVLGLSGRTLSVAGPGSATFLLPAVDQQRPVLSKTITARQRSHRSANDYLVDLTQWRRQAIDRQLPAFPPAEPKSPYVEHGTLVIVGGGAMPRGLMTEFIDYAGGLDKAKLVYVPCSEQQKISDPPSTVGQWNRLGVKHATFIHTKDRIQANSDEDFLAPLKDATGIWFGGGRQWNFADSYYGTKAQVLMNEVLKRGGVVGGSSAGASIQASFLARATPIENTQILAPGYLRGGLGFISGVAIDQHFSQRRRWKDMNGLVEQYPEMLGIGIDEGTALIVRKSVGTVVGKGDVYFYDRKVPVIDGDHAYVKLSAGSEYELSKREVLKTGLLQTESQSIEK